MQIAAMDLFVVPSVTFDLLYTFITVRLARRDLVWINVTSHPTAEWITHQITEALPWNEAPRYLILATIHDGKQRFARIGAFPLVSVRGVTATWDP
jgi:hypothetical protein